MKNKLVKLTESFESIKHYYSPKIIGELNDQYVKLVKILGQEVPWHNHENEDELFFILDGELLMEIENEESFKMQTGDLFIVKKGLNHRVS